MLYYIQETGDMYHNGTLLWTGYAGNGEGLNNPKMESVARTGPLPAGIYEITTPYNHPKLGPYVMNLVPTNVPNIYGRYGFRIHGDNDKHDRSASQGCIVRSPQSDRELLWKLGESILRVFHTFAEAQVYMGGTPL